jgi:hypothetical protein
MSNFKAVIKCPDEKTTERVKSRIEEISEEFDSDDDSDDDNDDSKILDLKKKEDPLKKYRLEFGNSCSIYIKKNKVYFTTMKILIKLKHY